MVALGASPYRCQGCRCLRSQRKGRQKFTVMGLVPLNGRPDCQPARVDEKSPRQSTKDQPPRFRQLRRARPSRASGKNVARVRNGRDFRDLTATPAPQPPLRSPSTRSPLIPLPQRAELPRAEHGLGCIVDHRCVARASEEPSDRRATPSAAKSAGCARHAARHQTLTGARTACTTCPTALSDGSTGA